MRRLLLLGLPASSELREDNHLSRDLIAGLIAPDRDSFITGQPIQAALFDLLLD